MNKQLINAVSQSSYKCAETSELNSFQGHTIKFLGKHVIQTNPSEFDERLFSDIIFMQITFETRKRNTRFYVLRQGVPERRSSEGYASFK